MKLICNSPNRPHSPNEALKTHQLPRKKTKTHPISYAIIISFGFDFFPLLPWELEMLQFERFFFEVWRRSTVAVTLWRRCPLRCRRPMASSRWWPTRPWLWIHWSGLPGSGAVDLFTCRNGMEIRCIYAGIG